jgi:hypothetical protein
MSVSWSGLFIDPFPVSGVPGASPLDPPTSALPTALFGRDQQRFNSYQKWHQQSEAAKNEAEKLPHGKERDALVRKARQLKTASQIKSMAVVARASAAEVTPPQLAGSSNRTKRHLAGLPSLTRWTPSPA